MASTNSEEIPLFAGQNGAERSALREMVTRILGDLVRGGYLRIERPRMILAGRLPAAWRMPLRPEVNLVNLSQPYADILTS